MMSEKERIEHVMTLNDLNAKQLADEIGVNSSNISHILNGRNNPSLEIMRKILERFPEVNPDWLILGEGTALRSTSASQMPSLFQNQDVISSKSISYDQKNETEKKSEIDENRKTAENSEPVVKFMAQSLDKEIDKIIVYFSDNTFREFYSK